MLDAARLVGLLAEPDRLRVVAALTLGAATVSEVSDATGLDLRATVAALERLDAAGLVERDGETCLLLEAAFKRAARAGAQTAPPSAHPGEPLDRRRVLDQCFEDGRLVHLPRKRSKRLVVLDELAQRFEPGVHYTERQVNASISEVHPDTAQLRRSLVDEGFLDRDHGEYWRSGGSIR